MNLINIANKGRKIYLFLRDYWGKLTVKEDNTFFPYYYTESPEGRYRSYKGDPLKKILVSSPSEVAKNRGNNSWESDIIFTKRYVIDKVDKITKCPIKYAFIDTEILADELPDVMKAKYPISCISIYNSFSNKITTFYLGDYPNEEIMLDEFISYMVKESFDLWLSWNVKFDYNYLHQRVKDFAKRISPIGLVRYGEEDILYPAGMSIVDYLSLYKKYTLNKEERYSLDYIAQKHLGRGKTYTHKNMEFGTLNENIRKRNIEDVEIMAKLEEKFGLIDYYNEIRMLSKIEWEDLLWNSRAIDMLLLAEAKKQKVVLPMKPKDNEKEEYEGAYRRCFQAGVHWNVGAYDLGSAYPNMIVDFNIDPANIREEKGDNTIEINGTHFEQNEKVLLPRVVNKLITLKNEIKQKLSILEPGTDNYKETNTTYAAVKGLVNSSYGVMALRFFRLYETRVASSITYLVRDLLQYVEAKLKALGHSILYTDTDGLMLANNIEDISDKLNEFIQQWAKEKYGKDNIGINFGHEGIFKAIILLAKCRYFGRLETSQGIAIKQVGIETKRKDSTIFLKKFQRTLLDKILDKVSKSEIISWIKEQMNVIRTRPLTEVAFPCKLARSPEEYKNVPVFLRALNNTPNFTRKVGEPFYYIYVNPTEYDTKTKEIMLLDGEKLTGNKLKKEWEILYNEKKNIKDMSEEKKEDLLLYLNEQGRLTLGTEEVRGKAVDVIAFDEDTEKTIDRERIDWKRIISRNIENKVDVVFEALNWKIDEIKEGK